MTDFLHGNASGQGLKKWWLRKRVIMGLIPLCGLVISLFLKASGAEYAQVVNFIAHPVVTTGLILFLVLFFYHISVEIVGCIEDYLSPPWFVRSFIVVVHMAAIFFALLGIVCILKISLGGSLTA